MKFRFSWLVAAVLAMGGCGNNSNVIYIKVAPGTSSGFMGTDCPGNSGNSVTFSGIDGDGTVAIYTEPNGKYYLDPGSATGADNGIEGSLAGTTYTFNGTWSADLKSNDEIQTEQVITITLTGAGNGYTGTLTIEDKCQSANNDLCGGIGPNPFNGGGGPFAGLGASVTSTDAKDFDCTESETLEAIQVPGIQQIGSPGTRPPTGPTSP